MPIHTRCSPIIYKALTCRRLPSASLPIHSITTRTYPTFRNFLDLLKPFNKALLGTKEDADMYEKTETGEPTSDPLHDILLSNKAWSAETQKTDPNLLPTLSKGQSPKILWIGCSDSRVPETTILGLKPGDVFVHRNIANVLSLTDLSSLAVIEYAVVYLKVQHIVVCGHTSCGGVAAALGNKRLGKIDTWLMPLRYIRMQNREALEGLSEVEKARKMVELNVKASVDVLKFNPDVIQSIKERGMDVHGMVYDLAKGELTRVDCGDELLTGETLEAFEVK